MSTPVSRPEQMDKTPEYRLLHHPTTVNTRGDELPAQERRKAGLLAPPGTAPESGRWRR